MTSRPIFSLSPPPGPPSPQPSSAISIHSSSRPNSSIPGTSTHLKHSPSSANHTFASVVPEVSVDIPDLESFHNDLHDHPLSLTVKCDDGSLSTLNAVKSPLLDLQSLDFLGPAEVIKKIFKLPHSNDQPYFALHRMGNTLLVDSLVGIEEHEKNNAFQDLCPDVALFSPDRPMNSLIGNMSATTAVSNFMCGLPEPPTQIVEDNVMQGCSPYLPPPGYYFPQHPPVLPFRNTFRWQLQDLEFAVGSDLLVYNAPDRPALTVAPIDMTKEIPLTTCLDHYLDNVMANVPELALCLHAKGFLRGISVCGTEDIPDLRNVVQSNDKIEGFSPKNINRVKQKNGKKTPLFDPQVIELNALTILRFLKQNCSKENSTYIVHFTRKEEPASSQEKENSSSPDAIQIYDLQALSLSGQKKWKWLLAMLSHRFATRLGNHYSIASPQSRVILRDRQLSLYQSCYDLLVQIRQLGGGNHGTICAAVLEHIADIHKSRAETSHKNKYNERNPTEYSVKKVGHDSKSAKRKRSKKKSNDKPAEFTPSCDLECTHNNSTFQSDFHDDELDNIDYAFEIDKSLELFLRAMSDLGEVITSQLAESNEGSSESMNSIFIGDIACEASEPLENFEFRDSRISATPVNLVLVIQYSGLFHKALSSCMSMIKNTLSSSITRLGDSRLLTAMQYLNQIIPYCKQWLSVTAKIKEDLVAYREQNSAQSAIESPLKTPTFSLEEALLFSETNPAEVLEESIQDMWSIDRTVLEDLPLFWDLLGELCREIFTMKPNMGDTQDLEILAAQLKDWKALILNAQEIIVCFLQMSTQASRSTSCCFNFLNDPQVPVLVTESKMTSLWTLLTGREWTFDDNSPFISTSKNVFKMLVSSFQDNIFGEEEVLSSRLVDLNLLHTSVHLLKIQTYSFLLGTLLLMRSEYGWSRTNWLNQLPLSDPFNLSQSKLANQVVRHFGDACNELGQMLFRALSVPSMPSSAVSTTAVAQDSNADSILREVYEDFQKKIVILADTANACYTSAIEIFAILQNKPTDGNANLIAVRCNMSCLRRFLSSTLCEMIQKSIKERSDFPSAILQTNSSPLLKCSLRSRKRDHTGAKFFSPLEYIYQAVEICQDSIFNIQTSAALQSTGAPSILSLELATNYTFSGLLYRKCLGDISISSVLNTKVAVTPNTEEIIRLIHQAIEHFEKALSIFNEIASHPGATKNIPVIHYHLGSLRAMLWGYEIRKLSDNFSSQYENNLEQSMSHYSHAHTYFLKYDVGPTLILILTDMTEMYLHSFHLREAKLAEELLALKGDQFQSQESVSRIVTIRQFVTSLLGGAFRVLVDCRFALTGVVLERHGQAMIDGGIIHAIATLLKTLLLKLIKYLSSRAYQILNQSSSPAAGASHSDEQQTKTIQLLKGIYSEALKTNEWYCNNPLPPSSLPKDAVKAGEVTTHRRDVRSLYEMLEKLNSCVWLRSHL